MIAAEFVASIRWIGGKRDAALRLGGGAVAVVNEGIAGNRLLASGFGLSALALL
jgi:hypothetical protein